MNNGGSQINHSIPDQLVSSSVETGMEVSLVNCYDSFCREAMDILSREADKISIHKLISDDDKLTRLALIRQSIGKVLRLVA